MNTVATDMSGAWQKTAKAQMAQQNAEKFQNSTMYMSAAELNYEAHKVHKEVGNRDIAADHLRLAQKMALKADELRSIGK